MDLSNKPGSIAYVLTQHMDELNFSNTTDLRNKVIELIRSDEVSLSDEAKAKEVYKLEHCPARALASTIGTMMTAEKVLKFGYGKPKKKKARVTPINFDK